MAFAAIVGWYLLAYAILHPLANAPVADSWLYGEAARFFRETGRIRFAGFTDAMPVAQVIYGAVWALFFGAGSISLEISEVALGAVAALVFFAMARRCGAQPSQALLATGMMVCNPCYLFLSFSFMTEIPFLAALIAVHWAFARAEGDRELPRLWLAAALSVIAFLVRPFAGAAILGCIGA
ncbi:MAG TPA: glycosyltransferase family 39 protein, partial [Candidatus Binataceae bacterium]